MRTLLFLLVPTAMAQIYVSPTGNDSNAGTEARPVQTLQRARDLVRSRNRAMTSDITVQLAPGTYRLNQPLILDARDSGTGGHNIVYTGTDAVISGGMRVTGWVAGAKNLWSAPAPAGLKDTRQLYIDGARASRTRGRLPVNVTPTAVGYTTDAATMASWRNQSGIEFVYTGGNPVWSEPSEGLGPWTEPRCPVASISATAITMAQPCWDNSTKRVMLASGARSANLVGPMSVGKRPAYIENAYELLGNPGEWYFDRIARRIYYTPRPGEDLTKADVEAAALESLIIGQGTAEKPIHNIQFSGLQFSYATWLMPNSPEGFSEIQANYFVSGKYGYSRQGLCTLVAEGACPYGAWSKAPGNLSFLYATDLKFTRDAFLHLGGAGLDLNNGAQRNVVEGSVFTDISGDGLELGNVDLPLAAAASVTSDNRISNNHFYNVGAEFRGGIPIVVGYAQRTKVQHNQIDHVPYAAISMGWGGWPDKVKLPGQANFSENNVVSENLIHDLMLVLADGGGIYTQGLTGHSLADGEKVTGNVVTRQYGSGHSLYTDNGSCYVTVANNIIFDTNFDNWGSRHANYYDGKDGSQYDPLLIEGNYWQQGDEDNDRRGVVERGNVLISKVSESPAAIWEHAGLESSYRDVLQRSFGKPVAPEAPSRVAAAPGDAAAYVTWSPSVFEGGSPVISYKVTASTGAVATIGAEQFWQYSYVKINGLPNGKAVRFTVTAANAAGESVPSMVSAFVTPTPELQPLAAPQRVTVSSGNGKASIHFQAPKMSRAEEETNPLLAYSVTVNPGGRKVIFTGRRITSLAGTHTTFDVIDGLTSGETYTFSVAAIGAAGEGAPLTTPAVTIK
jgi:Right handed beta helix region/Fibronectin type III domain